MVHTIAFFETFQFKRDIYSWLVGSLQATRNVLVECNSSSSMLMNKCTISSQTKETFIYLNELNYRHTLADRDSLNTMSTMPSL